MTDLTSMSCIPCKGGVPPLTGMDLDHVFTDLPVGGWQLVGEHHVTKTFMFANFVDGLEFVNAVGALAEREGHHPELCLSWGKVRVDVWTHKVDGLTESDFILAAKIDALKM